MRVRTSKSLAAFVLALATAAGTVGAVAVDAGPAAAAVFTDVVSSTPNLTWVPNNGVHALAQDANWIYLGGAFTSLKNPTTKATFAAAGLVRLSIATGDPDPTWTPSVNGDIRTMVLDPATSILYLGGDFTTVDATTRGGLGAVSTADTGSLSGWYPGAADGEVRTLIQLDAATLMAGGAFQHLGATRRTHLAEISTAGVIASFNPAINGTVYTAAHLPGSSFVYLGGLFTTLSGVARAYVAAMDITTGQPTAWNPGTPCPNSTLVCPVFAFVPTPTAVYAAAGGKNPSGETISYDPTTGARNWTVTADGDNQALALIGSELLIGGHFGPGFDNATRTTLAGVEASTGQLGAFAPSATNLFPGTWAMMALPDGSLVVGGDQNNIGGTADAKYAVFPPVPPPTTIEYVGNPSLEGGTTTGWQPYNGGSHIAAVQPAGGSHDGSWAMQISNPASAAALVGTLSKGPHWVSSDVAGTVYTGSVYLSGAAGSKVTLVLKECNAGGTSCPGSSTVVVTVPASGWIQATTTYTALTSGDAVRFAVFATLPAHGTMLADSFSLTAPVG